MMKNKMREIYLISEKTLKSKSYINDNVDSCFIKPAIQTAQDLGLQPLIGTCLYDALKTKVFENTVDGIYTELLDDYIQPYLIFKVMSDIQIPLAYKQRNSGIVQTNNQYVDNTIMQDAQRLMTYYDQKATFYANRLTKYLCKHSNKIPEYKQCCDSSGMRPDSHAFNTSIFLD